MYFKIIKPNFNLIYKEFHLWRSWVENLGSEVDYVESMVHWAHREEWV